MCQPTGEVSPDIFKLRFAGKAVSFLAREVGGKRHIVMNLWILYLGIWTCHLSEKDVRFPLPTGKGKESGSSGLEVGEREERIKI